MATHYEVGMQMRRQPAMRTIWSPAAFLGAGAVLAAAAAFSPLLWHPSPPWFGTMLYFVAWKVIALAAGQTAADHAGVGISVLEAVLSAGLFLAIGRPLAAAVGRRRGARAACAALAAVALLFAALVGALFPTFIDV